MAVVYEDMGGNLTKAYSDQGFLIHGGMPEDDYAEAIDPTDMHRTYTETNIPIEPDEEPVNKPAHDDASSTDAD